MIGAAGWCGRSKPRQSAAEIPLSKDPDRQVTLLYNLLMAAADAAALVFARRRNNLPDWLATMLCAAVFAAAGGMLLGEDHFGVTRLWAWGLFLHGAVLSAGSAVLLWRLSKPAAAVSAATALILIGVAVDAFLIEPAWLEVSHYRIASEKLDRPLRIVVLADLQTDRIGRYEREAFRQALQQNPDLILLAGDYLQVPWDRWMKLRGELSKFLQHIDFSAPQGVFAVRGNVDPLDWHKIFDGLHIEAVSDTRSFDLDGLRLTCLGLYDSYSPNLAVSDSRPEQFHIVLGHVPDFALGEIEADLLLAGHTHGGQVRLPLVGPLSTHSRIPRSWAAGMTELPGGRRLLVSRGIGMERASAPRIRFLCRPELTVIDLVPQKR